MGYEWGEQLFASPHRLALLRELQSEPADTQALTGRISASRVTVQRHLNQCSELGWVRKAEGRYELTPVGERVCGAATAFLDRLSVLESHEGVIDRLAAIDDEFDPLLLGDATVSVADETNPHEPIIHYRNGMKETTTEMVRGMTPVFSELLVEVHDELLSDGVETELLAPYSVLEAAPPPADDIPPSMFTVYALEDSLDFGLTLTDDTVFVGAYDDGTFAACIESDEPAFCEWVADVYERYRERAVRIPFDDEDESRNGDGDRDRDEDELECDSELPVDESGAD